MWYLLIHRIPPRPLYLRAKIRQRLSGVGALALKNSVYLLPKSSAALEDFQWIAEEIRAGGGEAYLFQGTPLGGAEAEAMVARFRALAGTEYAALAEEIRSAMKSARGAAAAQTLSAGHARLTSRLEEIERIDFFDAAERAATEKLLSSMESRIRQEQKEERRMVKVHRQFQRKVWATRPGIGVDRMASAWFIRRFIDPKARFRFVDPSAASVRGEMRFDMVGGDFTHEDDRCTLETLIRRVGLPDSGVRSIAEIVHDIDLKEEKFGRAETSGVRKLIDGLMARYSKDSDRLEQGLILFDDLHAALRPRSRARRK